MTDSAWNIRIATAADHDDIARGFAAAMLFDHTPNEADEATFEPDRALVAISDGAVIGATKTYTRTLSVPGAVIPAAHVTGVGVRGTHRRRGVLSGLMRRQLAAIDESIAVLWATEPRIYGRFGYEVSAFDASMSAQLPQVGSVPPANAGVLRELSAETAAEVLAPILTRYQASRPGVSGRPAVHWTKHLQDPPDRRNGATARRILVHESETGIADGYALWRGKFDWGRTGPSAEVRLEELVATDLTAYQALWHHVLTMDLAGTLSFRHGALDEPIRQLVGNPRALGTELHDSLWLRITDVARALQQRRYATGVDLVLQVSDPLLAANDGRFRLVAGPDEARCEPTREPADLSMSINALGGVYLGARSFGEFAASGAVTEHTPGAILSGSAAFGWPIAATSIEVF